MSFIYVSLRKGTHTHTHRGKGTVKGFLLGFTLLVVCEILLSTLVFWT